MTETLTQDTHNDFLRISPDLHVAPLPTGVYISAAGKETRLGGGPNMVHLVRPLLEPLTHAASLKQVLDTIDPAHQEAATRIIALLRDRGMIHEAIATEQIPADQRAEHPELAAYMDTHATHPATAFAQARTTTIDLQLPEPTRQALLPLANQMGLNITTGPATWTITDTTDHEPQTQTQAQATVPITATAGTVVVGPWSDAGTQDHHGQLLARTPHQNATSDLTAAMTVAASYALQLVLERLSGAALVGAYLINADNLSAHRLDLTPEPEQHTYTLGLNGQNVTDDLALTNEDLAAELVRWSKPYAGTLTPVDDTDLPQMPVALRRMTDLNGTTLLGTGVDQTDAAQDLLLTHLRTTIGQHAGVGRSPLRALLDGVLRTAETATERQLSAEHHLTVTDDEPTLHELTTVLNEYSTAPIRYRQTTQFGWTLAQIEHAGLRRRAWGPDLTTALTSALRQMIATRRTAGTATQWATTRATAVPAATDQINTTDTDTLITLGKAVHHTATTLGMSVHFTSTTTDRWTGGTTASAGTITWLRHNDTEHPGDDQPLNNLARTFIPEDLQATTDLTLMHGWDPDTWTHHFNQAQLTGRALLPITIGRDSLTIGPLWNTTTNPTGCAGCAELRHRLVLDHTLRDDLHTARTATTQASPVLIAALNAISHNILEPGQLHTADTDGIRSAYIARHPACPWCGFNENNTRLGIELNDHPVSPNDPTRVNNPTPVLNEDWLDTYAVNPEYGPVRGILRESHVPMAMSMAVLAGGTVMGHGRGLTYNGTRPVAVLEALERLAGFPTEATLLTDTAYTDIAEHAIDPRTLGQYTDEQRNHPSSRTTDWDENTVMDWAEGTDLSTGESTYVPAEIGFYLYDHHFKRNQRASQKSHVNERRRYFLESSSGCAVGTTGAEAALHALLEVAERDAFQLAWHAANPLPRIPLHTINDPEITRMVGLANTHGYDIHCLVLTQDIDIPIVWLLALRRDGQFPATFSSAGSGANPISAIRSALREVTQLVVMPRDWTIDQAAQMLDDPYKVTELEHHVHYSSHPTQLPKLTRYLQGPETTIEKAFPDWPNKLRPTHGGILEVLTTVTNAFHKAGLTKIVLVDQGQREHTDLGVNVVKAVVPGTVPMCFGHAHQRLTGIPRLTRALNNRPTNTLDPHPFP